MEESCSKMGRHLLENSTYESIPAKVGGHHLSLSGCYMLQMTWQLERQSCKYCIQKQIESQAGPTADSLILDQLKLLDDFQKQFCVQFIAAVSLSDDRSSSYCQKVLVLHVSHNCSTNQSSHLDRASICLLIQEDSQAVDLLAQTQCYPIIRDNVRKDK